MTTEPMQTGDRVAWQAWERWSCTHRVFQRGRTFCSRPIPAHAVVNGKLSGGTCSRCERMYRQAEQYRRETPGGVAA